MTPAASRRRGAAALIAILALAPVVARAEILPAIRQRGEIVVGMEAALQPFEYIEDGRLVGYDPDILEHIAARLGVKVRLVDTAWDGIIPALYARKFDAILSGMTITAARAQKVSFSMPYAEATHAILLRADETRIRVPDDLSGRRVGAQISGVGDINARKFQESLIARGRPGYADYKLYDHYPEAYVDLDNRRIDAVINQKAALLVLMKQRPGRYRLIDGIQEVPSYIGMAIRKEDGDLLAAVDAALAAMKRDGSLAALQVKWFGATMTTPDAVPARLP